MKKGVLGKVAAALLGTVIVAFLAAFGYLVGRNSVTADGESRDTVDSSASIQTEVSDATVAASDDKPNEPIAEEAETIDEMYERLEEVEQTYEETPGPVPTSTVTSAEPTMPPPPEYPVVSSPDLEAHFTTYTTTAGLPSARIYQLQIEPDGTLWAGTDNGLAKFQNGRWQTVSGTEGWSVYAFWVRGSEIWATCPDWLCRFEADTWRATDPPDGLTDSGTPVGILSLFIDSRGNLWAGTYHMGLGRWRDGQWNVYGVADGLPSDIITAISEDSAGYIVVVASGLRGGGPVQDYDLSGVAGFDGNNWIQVPNTPTIERYRAPAGDLWITPDGQFWISNGEGGGVYELTGGNWIEHNVAQMGPSVYSEYGASSRTVAADNLSVWVGLGCTFGCRDGSTTRWGGLFRIVNGQWLDYSFTDGLKENNITDIVVAAEGVIYVGTSGGGVVKIEESETLAQVPTPTATLEQMTGGNGVEEFSQIAFVSERDGQSEIYLVDADGGNLINLTNNPARDHSPAWSPEGTRLAFVSDRNGSSQLYVMNADGSEVRQLTDVEGRVGDPVWSPHGDRIAFYAQIGMFEEMHVYWVESDGSDLTKVFSQSGYGGGISWSPDGQELLFDNNPGSDRGFDLLMVGLDGGDMRAVASTESWEFTSTLSPDGAKVAFATDRFGGAIDVYVSNLDGTGTRNLTQDINYAFGPVWSPRGEYIALMSAGEGAYIVRVDSGAATKVASFSYKGGDGQISWSPDGALLAFSAPTNDNYEVYVSAPDGSGLINLSDHPARDRDPVWRP